MAKENEAWFQEAKTAVEGFEAPDCPHGQLFRNSGDNEFEYICTRCGELFHAHPVN